MKRFALLVGVLAVVAGTKATADVEFKNSGDFRVRYENMLNATGNDASGQSAMTSARLKWNLSARGGEKTSVFLTLLHNSNFGAGNDATNGGSTPQTGYSAVSDHNGILVNRAYGWWKAADAVSFKVGRFGIAMGDGSFFSENDWENTPYAFEGLDASFDTNFAKIDVYAIKQAELAARAGNSDPEQNLYMVSADIKNMPEALKTANVVLLQVNRDATGTGVGAGSQNYQHIGATVGGEASMIMYKADLAFQFGSFDKPDTGQETKLNANMFDVMVGYHMAEAMGLKVSLAYHQDSGDSSATDDKQETYKSLYYEKHGRSGLMDVLTWGNLTYFNLNASIMPAEDLEAGLGIYMFSRTKDTAGANFAPAYAGLASATSTDKALGNEADLFVNKSYDKDLKIGARLGWFIPGDYLKNGVPTKHDKNLMDAYLQASLAF
jgi:hypothetical protein